jgi:hypothetical protein
MSKQPILYVVLGITAAAVADHVVNVSKLLFCLSHALGRIAF